MQLGNTHHNTVLVVDDDEMIRIAATMILHAGGFEVITAADGQDAITVFSEKQRQIALILLDVNMPEMDGKECFARLRAIQPDIPVLFSSGYNRGGKSADIIADGKAGFIKKPYDARDLIAICNSTMGRTIHPGK